MSPLLPKNKKDTKTEYACVRGIIVCLVNKNTMMVGGCLWCSLPLSKCKDKVGQMSKTKTKISSFFLIIS